MNDHLAIILIEMSVTHRPIFGPVES